ncbi:MAG: class I SAM-dependent methyltransferase [Anaerolineae bacterium]|nr:class I SAM-dependent methyltransferase [Anaerolineae bacterium]MDH7474260.1 methyltransferase domain-containing protein [Anaerolineae bacterium]
MSKNFDYERFYDLIAPVYGVAMRLIPVWRHYTEVVLSWLPPSGAVLEIGPGPGLLLTKLVERYSLAVGLDLSSGMLRQAQRRLRCAHLSVRLVRAEATHLPFPAGSFDGIVITFTFSAIPNGLAAMEEMARVLRAGGRLTLVDAGMPGDGNPLGTGLARLWEKFGDFMRDEAALMREAGLEVIECREFGAFNSIRLVVGRQP